MFSGYRGEEVIQNLQDRGQNVLSSYLQYVNHSVFGYCLIPILVILVLSLITAFHSGELTLHVKTRQGSNSEAILESIHVERSRKPYTGRDYNKLAIAIVLTITSVFFIYVAAVGSQVVDSRYIAPVYPLISMLAVEMLYLIFRNLRFSKFSVPALLVSVALIIRCSLQNDGVMYQYKDFDTARRALENQGRYDCVIYWTGWRDIFTCYGLNLLADETALLNDTDLGNMSAILDHRETEDPLIVNLDSNLSEEDRTNILNEILSQTGAESYEQVASQSSMIFYLIR